MSLANGKKHKSFQVGATGQNKLDSTSVSISGRKSDTFGKCFCYMEAFN